MGYPYGRFSVYKARITILASLIASSLTFTPHPAPASPGGFASIKLVWTAPGDDGRVGRATKYDLRIKSSSVSAKDTLGWWNNATVISMIGKTPGAPGALDSVLIGGLTAGTRYYAILRVADERPNWSGFSNMASFVPGIVTSTPDGAAEAPAFVVGAPRPSPMSGRTAISLELPRATQVEAHIFNAHGKLVSTLQNGFLPAGVHVLRWDGRLNSGGDASSGVYYVTIDANSVRKKMRLVVVR